MGAGSSGGAAAPPLVVPTERSTTARHAIADDPRRWPGEFHCQEPRRGMAWLYGDGRLEYVRCGSPNRCDYCAMLTACENAVVLRLDAYDCASLDLPPDQRDFATVGLTTTTWRPGVSFEGLRKSEQLLWRQLRRRYGKQVGYCGFLEWTTGMAARSGGHRRPHLHHLVKRLEWFDGLEAEVSELWRRFSSDGAWRVECRPLYTPMGAIAYLVLHHHKREQGPPPGTKHTKRLRPSRNFFNRPIPELREQARKLLEDTRLYAELAEVLNVPERMPSFLVEELIAERVDAARARAEYVKPKLVRVRERRQFDTTTGVVWYEFERVLGPLR